MADKYFNNAVNTDYNDLGNWWDDDLLTVPASSLPVGGDVIYITQTALCDTNVPTNIFCETHIDIGGALVTTSATVVDADLYIEGGTAQFIGNVTFSWSRIVEVITGSLFLAATSGYNYIYASLHVYASTAFTVYNGSTTRYQTVQFDLNSVISISGAGDIYGDFVSDAVCEFSGSGVVNTVKTGGSFTGVLGLTNSVIQIETGATCTIQGSSYIRNDSTFSANAGSTIILDDGSSFTNDTGYGGFVFYLCDFQMIGSATLTVGAIGQLNFTPSTWSISSDATIDCYGTISINVTSLDVNFLLAVESGATLLAVGDLIIQDGGRFFFAGLFANFGYVEVQSNGEINLNSDMSFSDELALQSGCIASINNNTARVTIQNLAKLSLDSGATLDVQEGILTIDGEFVFDGILNIGEDGFLSTSGRSNVYGGGTLNRDSGSLNFSNMVAGTNVIFPNGGGNSNILGALT